jgi:hypothetical protein
MRFNIRTIISFALLLSALLINIRQYPQVQEMLGQELQANLIQSILSYKFDYKSDNANKSGNSDNCDESADEINESLDNLSAVPLENLPKSESSPDSSKTVTPSQPATLPQLSTPQPTSPILPPPTQTPKLNPPLIPSPSDVPVAKEQVNNPNPNSTPKQNLSQFKTSQEKQFEKESPPEENLPEEIPIQNFLLQNVLPDKNSAGATWQEVNSHYVIYSLEHPAAPTPDSPQLIYANQYQPRQTEQNKTITIKQVQTTNSQITDTKNKTQTIPEIKQKRLINTIETTLERPIIYD